MPQGDRTGGAPSRYPHDWAVVHRHDPAMDVHLALLAEVAEEALRMVRDAQSLARRIPPAPDRLAARTAVKPAASSAGPETVLRRQGRNGGPIPSDRKPR